MDRIRDYFRSPSTGNGISGRTVSLRRLSDNTEITTTTTDANGRFTFDMSDIGFDEGKIYYAVDDGSGTYKRHAGDSYGQIGPVWWDAVVKMFSAFGKGVMSGYEVSADGSGMEVSVSAGVALTKDGIPVYSDSAQTVTITAADGSNPRIDRIVLRTTRIGQTEEGKVELIAVAGTPASSPTAPSLTASSSADDITLAQVLVDAGAVVIASGKVTDERTLTGQEVLAIPLSPALIDNGIDATQIADGSVTNAEFQYLGSVTSDLQTQLDAKADVSGETFSGDVRVNSNTVSTFRAAKGANSTDVIFNAGHSGAEPTVSVWNSGKFRTYSDAASTETFLVDGATGNVTADGTVTADTVAAVTVSAATTMTVGGVAVADENHTHTLTAAPINSCTKARGYTAVTATSGNGDTLTSCTIDVPSGGADIIMWVAAQLNAPSGGSITLGAQIGTASTMWGDVEEVVGGDKSNHASAYRVLTSGASGLTCSVKAKVSGGTGSATTAHGLVFAIPKTVPAS